MAAAPNDPGGEVRPADQVVIDKVTFARDDRAIVHTTGRLSGDGTPVLSLTTEAWIHRRPAGVTRL